MSETSVSNKLKQFQASCPSCLPPPPAPHASRRPSFLPLGPLDLPSVGARLCNGTGQPGQYDGLHPSIPGRFSLVSQEHARSVAVAVAVAVAVGYSTTPVDVLNAGGWRPNFRLAIAWTSIWTDLMARRSQQ